MVLGAVASALYIVDAHRDIAIEGFTCLLVFKNILSFGLTFSGFHWLGDIGIKPVFLAISSVQVVVCCSTVLMCKLLPFGGSNLLIIMPQTFSERRIVHSSQGMIS